MDWTSSARVRLLAGVLPLGLLFLLFSAEKSTLRSRNFPTALALDFHPYPLYGRINVWGLLAVSTDSVINPTHTPRNQTFLSNHPKHYIE